MDSAHSNASHGVSRTAASTKIVIAGGFGVGKTTLVGSVSEIVPLRTEALVTNESVGVDDLAQTPAKSTTTVAMDFGRITVDEAWSSICSARRGSRGSGSCGTSWRGAASVPCGWLLRAAWRWQRVGSERGAGASFLLFFPAALSVGLGADCACEASRRACLRGGRPPAAAPRRPPPSPHA